MIFLSLTRKDLLTLVRHFAAIEGTCLLYSGGGFETAERSFLSLFPYEALSIPPCQNPWEILKPFFHFHETAHPFPEWTGYFAYEMGAFSDDAVLIPHDCPIPYAYWQRCAITLMVDHSKNAASIQFAEGAELLFDDDRREWIKKLSKVSGWLDLIKEREQRVSFLRLVRSSESETSYIEKIGEIQRMISSGDVYQLNLSQQFDFSGDFDPYDLFCTLAKSNPTPFAAYFCLSDFTIISTSPERFLKKTGSSLETRPIKGTAPRGNTSEEDEERKLRLLRSPKERAELLMITDLMRNDLGKMSKLGSVSVPLIQGCDAYAHLFHLYSIVRSELKTGVHPLDAVRACFPGGSVTGCPKLRAMQAIADLEKRPRGIYTGSLGYFTANGDFDLNIAIRTFIAQGNTLSAQLGGGIVVDSDPHDEYRETLHKGQSLFDAIS